MAAITPVELTSFLGAGGTSMTTSSITPVVGKAHLAVVWNADSDLTAATPTITGAGLTWTQKLTATKTVAGNLFQMRMTMFQGTGTPSAGALTISFGGDNQDSGGGYSIVDFTGGTTFNQYASAVSLPGTSGQAQLVGPLRDANSLAFGVVFHDIFESTTVGSGYTQLDDIGNASDGDLLIEYKTNTLNINASWATNADWIITGAEVIAGGPQVGFIG